MFKIIWLGNKTEVLSSLFHNSFFKTYFYEFKTMVLVVREATRFARSIWSPQWFRYVFVACCWSIISSPIFWTRNTFFTLNQYPFTRHDVWTIMVLVIFRWILARESFEHFKKPNDSFFWVNQILVVRVYCGWRNIKQSTTRNTQRALRMWKISLSTWYGF